MYIGVVGNREGWTYEYVRKQLLQYREKMDYIVSGGAEGVDTYAQDFAKELGIPILILYPKPEVPSPKRFFDRNLDIVINSDLIVAFDKGSSSGSGTQNTINHARKLNKPFVIYKEMK